MNVNGKWNERKRKSPSSGFLAVLRQETFFTPGSPQFREVKELAPEDSVRIIWANTRKALNTV